MHLKPLSAKGSGTDSGAQTHCNSAAVQTGPSVGIVLLVGGAIGLLAATLLLIEKLAVLKNPDYIPSCNVNPVLSCGSVMNTWQAEVFAIPNPILGIAGFAVVSTVGAGYLAGASYSRWFRIGLQIGITLAAIFVHWLIYQSLYVIGALCPYCMIVWIVTVILFGVITVGNARVAAQGNRRAEGVLEFGSAMLTAWFLAIVGLIAARFWSYWVTLV